MPSTTHTTMFLLYFLIPQITDLLRALRELIVA